LSQNAHKAFIGLGGNQGDVLATFRRALALLCNESVQLVDLSSAYRTPAMLPEGSTEQAPDYWNAVCSVSTSLDPVALLGRLMEAENQCGRVRRTRWESRTLDLDLLLYDDVEMKTDALTLPHPGIRQRIFVLRPLAEIAPRLRLLPDGQHIADAILSLGKAALTIVDQRKILVGRLSPHTRAEALL